MNSGVSYSMFYEILQNLREYFHSYGRIDDSNAKLDEITKLIATSYSLAFRGIHFDLTYVKQKSIEYKKKDRFIAVSLRKIFEEEAQQPLFRNEDGTNIFGAEPTLNIQPTENELAEKLVSEIGKIDFIDLIEQHKYSNFDLINECFGHFVRDNFRNNKEDAQYMTPLEIVEPILDIVFHDMESDGVFDDYSKLLKFMIMDPTCGVGTLLMQSANYFTKYVSEHVQDELLKQDVIADFRACGMIGQDKVDRMIRLSKINTLLLGGNISNINIGNSIVGKSTLSKYKGKVKFIFTNPPFGAEYSKAELDLVDYPLLSKIKTTSAAYPSELLMLDKSIALLCDEGYLAIVLPDAVFSAKGLYSEYRDMLLSHVMIKGVYELPPVTFAQAGTRTNTCVLYLKKKKVKQQCMYMSICDDVGYAVKERGGAPIKVKSGKNEMIEIATSIISNKDCLKIVSNRPSVTYISEKDLIENSLNPTFYAAERLGIVEKLASLDSQCIYKLADVAEFVTKTRKSMMVSDKVKHISVLHINPNTTISFTDVENFNPICKGRECFEGDVIFSKINPRIPRMAVIPKTKYKLVCSNEFEILRAKEGIDPYILCHLLRTRIVNSQIVNLTSGTSSSHNRIKTEQLADIRLPLKLEEHNIKIIGQKLKASTEKIYLAENNMQKELLELETL